MSCEGVVNGKSVRRKENEAPVLLSQHRWKIKWGARLLYPWQRVWLEDGERVPGGPERFFLRRARTDVCHYGDCRDRRSHCGKAGKKVSEVIWHDHGSRLKAICRARQSPGVYTRPKVHESGVVNPTPCDVLDGDYCNPSESGSRFV